MVDELIFTSIHLHRVSNLLLYGNDLCAEVTEICNTLEKNDLVFTLLFSC